MNLIPINPVPSQALAAQINNQACQLSVFTLATGLYFSLLLAGSPIVLSKICRNTEFLVNQGVGGINYSGFLGDFSFIDTQGQTDPVYVGLGTRYQLAYFAPGDYLS